VVTGLPCVRNIDARARLNLISHKAQDQPKGVEADLRAMHVVPGLF
jgi:hypothetical protein